MFFIIDIMPGRKVLKVVQALCQNCSQYGEIRLVKTSQCLRLFFIPLFKWGAVYTLEHSCGAVMRVSEENAIGILHAGMSVEQVPVEVMHPGVRRCPKCGRVLEAEFVRCPYCE